MSTLCEHCSNQRHHNMCKGGPGPSEPSNVKQSKAKQSRDAPKEPGLGTQSRAEAHPRNQGSDLRCTCTQFEASVALHKEGREQHIAAGSAGSRAEGRGGLMTAVARGPHAGVRWEHLK